MRRHEVDVFSLVTGLVFVAVAAGHLLDEGSVISFDGRWVVPLVMVAIGVASLAGLVRGRESLPDEPSRTAATTAHRGSRDGGTGSREDSDDTLLLGRGEP